MVIKCTKDLKLRYATVVARSERKHLDRVRGCALAIIIALLSLSTVVLCIIITGVARFISIKPILKEYSDLTFSFKLFLFLVASMSKTYIQKRINSPKIKVFRHNIWKYSETLFFHVLCLLLLLLTLNHVEKCTAKSVTPLNLKFCMKIDIHCRYIGPPKCLCKQCCLPVNNKNSLWQYIIISIHVSISLKKYISIVNESFNIYLTVLIKTTVCRGL